MPASRLSVLVVGALAVLAFMVNARPMPLAAQQQVPGNLVPGTIAPGSAAVQVVNQPTVQAVQAGEWRVSVPGGVTLNSGGTLSFEGPDFIEVGKRYTMRWGAGLTGTYTVVQVTRGWALVRTGTSRMWVNTALAVAIEEAR